MTGPLSNPPPLSRSVIFTVRLRLLTHGGRIVRDADTVFAEVAAMDTVVEEPTGSVVMENVVLLAPAAMLTLAGVVALPLLLSNDMLTPPAGAGAANVTVPVAAAPPCKLDGLRLMPLSVTVLGPAGVMDNCAETLVSEVPVMVAVRAAATADVDTAKVAELCPEAIVTLAGTVTEGSELDRLTETPPGVAGTASVTVPVAPAPPTTDEGLSVNPDTMASEGPAA